MTPDAAVTALASAAVAGLLARFLIVLRLQAPPPELLRTNVRGIPVPAVLGGPITLCSLASLTFVAALAVSGWEPARTDGIGFGIACSLVALHLAGRFDDRRGDEPDRGLRGHLRAAGAGRLTGGVVKIAAGVAAGAAAAALLPGVEGILDGVAVAAIVAGSANVANLLDRAPGRAGKAVLVGAVPLVALGPPDWMVGASGVLGALVAALPFDLKERAMLGDAGANPLGAVVGVGLAAAAGGAWRLPVAAAVIGLNLAAEVVSFSTVIERVPPLRAFDRWGRPSG